LHEKGLQIGKIIRSVHDTEQPVCRPGEAEEQAVGCRAEVDGGGRQL
jgi:hypothetical protein